MEDEATLRSEIKSNRRTTRVMRHNGFWTTYQMFAQLTTFALKPLTHRPLNRHPMSFEPSPHWSFLSRMTDPWGEGGN